jgi:hypothetical protein
VKRIKTEEAPKVEITKEKDNEQASKDLKLRHLMLQGRKKKKKNLLDQFNSAFHLIDITKHQIDQVIIKRNEFINLNYQVPKDVDALFEHAGVSRHDKIKDP